MKPTDHVLVSDVTAVLDVVTPILLFCLVVCALVVVFSIFRVVIYIITEYFSKKV